MAISCGSVSKYLRQPKLCGISGSSSVRLHSGASFLRLAAVSPGASHARRASPIVASTPQPDSAIASKPQSPLFRRFQVSPELQRIVGEPELTRQIVTQRVWKYIRVHNLQDPANKRNISCNAELGQVLGVEKTNMFELSKLLSKHLTHDGGSGPASPRPKTPKAPKVSAPVTGAKKRASPKPVKISRALMTFLGTEEKEMLRTEIVKKIWAYAKSNNLQDPSDGRKINCDTKLKSILQTDSVVGIGITKYLTPHILRD